ncbi:MAG: glycosyltransferase family 2 protein [Anaerolineae bacterium]|nr:MAG: glycosyltransferase family 2 protein [Anaerolineae bacterium]
MTAKLPAVSVVIPTYGRAALVQEAVASALAQTYTDIEIIVVDDGSPDNTESVLQSLAGAERIRNIRQANAGPAAARNRGLREARGKWVAFLDDDDLFEPDKLEKQLALAEREPEARFIHSDFRKFSADTPDLGVRETSWFSGNVYPEILAHWSTLMASPCVMVRRDVFGEVGEFDESLKWAEELDLWRRIARVYPFFHVPEPLTKVRQQTVSLSSDRSRAAAAYRIMLDKAFADDAALGEVFRRRALAAMYTNVSHNLLGEGGAAEMRQARGFARTALGFRPLDAGAWAGLAASFVPRGLRGRLARVVRQLRFRKSG